MQRIKAFPGPTMILFSGMQTIVFVMNNTFYFTEKMDIKAPFIASEGNGVFPNLS
jgi:hypothetical protein